MIVWFCNLKFLSIRSNVKRVDCLKLAEQIGKVRAERLEQNDQSRSKRLCSLSSVWAIHFCRYSLSGVDTCNDVPTSSPGRFSLALEVGRSTSKARESAPVRCLYFDFYLWILFSLYRIKMEIPKILTTTIVAATLISQTHSASLHSKPRTLQMRVTDVIPQKTANAMQKVWMSYLGEFITVS